MNYETQRGFLLGCCRLHILYCKPHVRFIRSTIIKASASCSSSYTSLSPRYYNLFLRRVFWEEPTDGADCRAHAYTLQLVTKNAADTSGPCKDSQCQLVRQSSMTSATLHEMCTFVPLWYNIDRRFGLSTPYCSIVFRTTVRPTCLRTGRGAATHSGRQDNKHLELKLTNLKF